MSTALSKQTMLVTFTHQHLSFFSNVLNEGQWYRIRNFDLITWHCTPVQLYCLAAKLRTRFSIAGLSISLLMVTHEDSQVIYNSHFAVKNRGAYYSHKKFLEHKRKQERQEVASVIKKTGINNDLLTEAWCLFLRVSSDNRNERWSNTLPIILGCWRYAIAELSVAQVRLQYLRHAPHTVSKLRP